MDKRWRNLAVILVVAIVLLVGYYFYQGYLNLSYPSVQKLTVDDGYLDLFSLFKKNDLDIENFQRLELVGMTPNGNVEWVVEKNKVLRLRDDLVRFYSSASEKYADFEELRDISGLYINIIDYSLRNEVRFKKISKIFSMDSVSCASFLPIISDANKIAHEIYLDAYALDLMSLDFSLKYDLLSDPVVIDLAQYESELTTIDSVSNAVMEECRGKV